MLDEANADLTSKRPNRLFTNRRAATLYLTALVLLWGGLGVLLLLGAFDPALRGHGRASNAAGEIGSVPVFAAMFVGMVASAGWREAARTEHLRGENTMRLKLVLLGGIADATRALKSPLGARIAYVALVLCTLLAGIVAVLVA